jgi:hypothetical protein
MSLYEMSQLNGDMKILINLRTSEVMLFTKLFPPLFWEVWVAYLYGREDLPYNMNIGHLKVC